MLIGAHSVLSDSMPASAGKSASADPDCDARGHLFEGISKKQIQLYQTSSKKLIFLKKYGYD
jgi:hypothetical protein